jgi:hypothetical protein
MMAFVQAMMTAGLCVLVGAAGFVLVTAVKRVRQPGGLRLTDDQRRVRLDWLMAVIWSGMLLVQIGNVILHQDPGGTYHLTSLTLVATGGEIFVCGVFAGRLLLRQELRRLKEKDEAQNRA